MAVGRFRYQSQRKNADRTRCLLTTSRTRIRSIYRARLKRVVRFSLGNGKQNVMIHVLGFMHKMVRKGELSHKNKVLVTKAPLLLIESSFELLVVLLVIHMKHDER